MSLCVVALWLAACVAARGVVARVVPVCDPNNVKNCHWLRTDRDDILKFDIEVYSINGKEHGIYSEKGKLFAADCSAATALDDPAWPQYRIPEDFVQVTLRECQPPVKGYAAALKALNVTATNKLSLKLPKDARISEAALSNLTLSVKDLSLIGRDDFSVKLEPGALAALHSLQTLFLDHIIPDSLPRNLSNLQLSHTGITVLPPEYFNLTSLELNENSIKSIKGSIPHMKSLRLLTPKLLSLVLHNTTPELLRDEFLKGCPELQVLELQQSRVSLLPVKLLKGATNLRNFTYTHGIITNLPQTFFGHSAILEVIDLSHNELTSLPRNVFSGLLKLRMLRLGDNHLSALDLLAVQSLNGLKALDLDRNPLGDLCRSGERPALPALENLEELSLAGVRALRVCVDWLLSFPSLRRLNLSTNNVRGIYCGDFRAWHGNETAAVIDIGLTDNPLERFKCMQAKLEGSLEELALKKMRLTVDSVAKCNCECPFIECVAKVVKNKTKEENNTLEIEKELDLRNVTNILNKIQSDTKVFKKKIKDIEKELIDLENSRKVAVYGLVENPNKDEDEQLLIELVSNVIKSAMGFDVKPYIEDIKRVGNKGNRRPIMVQLNNKRIAKLLLENVRNFEGSGVSTGKFEESLLK